MNNSKTGGPDGIVYEILKNNLQEVTLILTKLLNSIHDDEEIPWRQGWLVPIYKNGNKDSVSSYTSA